MEKRTNQSVRFFWFYYMKRGFWKVLDECGKIAEVRTDFLNITVDNKN